MKSSQLFLSLSLAIFSALTECSAFSPTAFTQNAAAESTSRSSLTIRYSQSTNNHHHHDMEDQQPADKSNSPSFSTHRRHFFSAVAGAAFWATYQTPAATAAEEETSTVVPMKDFVDPYGMFSIQVPEGFYTLRRKAKGDLPDEKTGKGRRGSSIFTAGNMAKAEVVAVERFPTRVLLEENGIEATGSLATFPDLGEPAAIASLINLRREKDKPGSGQNTVLDTSSVAVTSDGQELTFRLKTEIEVQKPELLMETYGVDRLFRITVAKASLRSKDGNILAVFASALETDFQGPDGPALEKTVQSFEAKDLSMNMMSS